MVAHFDSDRIDLPELADRLNCLLPQDVVINKIVPVAQQAHARFSAVERTYRYYITREKEPFYYRYKYYHPAPLQIEAMNRGARILMQYSDFTSFSKLHTDVFTNHCTIVQAKWEATGNDCVFTIAANRFLRNMVRAIVGTLLDMGRGKIDESALRAIVEAGDRSRAGQSAPAHALFLEKIDYPDEIFQV
jgi:tRNA pseudouridine38-40 synthase